MHAALREADTANSENSKSVDYSGGANLFNRSIECPAGIVPPITPSAFVSLDVNANVHAAISIGVVAVGTLIPPSFSDFALHIGVYVMLVSVDLTPSVSV